MLFTSHIDYCNCCLLEDRSKSWVKAFFAMTDNIEIMLVEEYKLIIGLLLIKFKNIEM